MAGKMPLKMQVKPCMVTEHHPSADPLVEATSCSGAKPIPSIGSWADPLKCTDRPTGCTHVLRKSKRTQQSLQGRQEPCEATMASVLCDLCSTHPADFALRDQIKHDAGGDANCEIDVVAEQRCDHENSKPYDRALFIFKDALHRVKRRLPLDRFQRHLDHDSGDRRVADLADEGCDDEGEENHGRRIGPCGDLPTPTRVQIKDGLWDKAASAEAASEH
mmetsp:Transcript_81486/g.205881  ORF Transcript_81486/g.205881 Transcript_81486/m.205881 type:complete len:219 (+) Transcript_81486:95-751(+)